MPSVTAHLPATLPPREGPRVRKRGLGLRLGVLIHRVRLDAALAEGVDPALSEQLWMRASQICSESHRHALADSFEKTIASVERPRPVLSARVPVAAREVLGARAALLELARVLRESETVDPAGVALAQRLLTDGSGPLYIELGDEALWHATRAAVFALDGRC